MLRIIYFIESNISSCYDFLKEGGKPATALRGAVQPELCNLQKIWRELWIIKHGPRIMPNRRKK